MAVTHHVNTRNAITDAVVDRVDLGTTNPNGQLIFLTAADAEVATLEFQNPAFGASVAAVATANTLTSDTSATGGTIAKAKFVDRDGNDVVYCSVTQTGGGGDIELSSLIITAGDTVTVDDPLTYTAPV